MIGASEAPTIMSENRWQSAQFLLEEKLGLKPEFTGNAATREGQRLEEDARRELVKKFQIELGPTVIQDGEVPYFAASLDAIDKKHTQVFEIKCGAKAYEIVASKREVPSYYFGQLQHILIEYIAVPFLSFGSQHQDLVRMLGIDAGTAIRHSIMKK